MVEGVLAVDTEGHVLDLNPAASRLLGLGGSDSRGRTIEEVVRNARLQAFVSRALAAPTTIEDEVVLERPEGDHYLQAHGTALRDGEGQEMGALVVLNDVTRIRQLENVRRDFVANVSHELKTPITSVKGFVETLLDGALDNREEAERFLRIVAKHADRLGVIIEDLLTLSRLEQDARAGRVDLAEASVEGALRAAVEMCEVRATERNVTVTVTCDPQLRADLNLPLFEQAIANLIDNAIKYSPTGGTVEVSAEEAKGELVVCVRDWGCGIAAEHLPRLFERFYRVDKARSRALGGTGLGLAIVKHIVQAHGGTVSVESTPGKGSTFTIRLPRALPPLPLSTT
jgi:two-component system phosphate regulon sensor histidine kinase PhoR